MVSMVSVGYQQGLQPNGPATGPSALVLTGRRLWRDCMTVTDVTGTFAPAALEEWLSTRCAVLPLLWRTRVTTLRVCDEGCQLCIFRRYLERKRWSVRTVGDVAGATRSRCLHFLQCAPADEAYFIAKEILATERTYLKDLEVITVWFRSAVVKADAMPADLMTLLFSNIDPIYEFHRGFLREVEQRLALCTQGPDGVLQEFIREGCLHKLTRKGLQQRMFFLVGVMGTVQAGGLIVRSQERVAEIRVLILGSGHLSAG
ncbi:hypothetical protein E2I00_000518 [Balaenoptera physalus]|uniref:DH domain-containing protein n=1 Tax=Balaenoptera physalus TaxID=9770 RepID=A0A643C722_BALPH|nr:hypothetical protein E2I00_000518 [Balaenoptera physalus]